MASTNDSSILGSNDLRTPEDLLAARQSTASDSHILNHGNGNEPTSVKAIEADLSKDTSKNPSLWSPKKKLIAAVVGFSILILAVLSSVILILSLKKSTNELASDGRRSVPVYSNSTAVVKTIVRDKGALESVWVSLH